MFKAINTKILLGILAALTAIGGLLIHQNHVREQEAADAAKARIILQQQQKAADDAKRDDEEMRRKVAEGKKKHSKAAGNESGTWQHYVP